MTRQYTSFLIRCWHLDGGERRIKIEHIQSGERTQVATLAAAIAWLSTRWGGQLGGSPAIADQLDSDEEGIASAESDWWDAPSTSASERNDDQDE
jgi:hypothetical protein